MRIVHIAPFEEPVPPRKYGGVELVVYNLVEEMNVLGHEVHLMASGDSKVSANLIPLVPKSLRAMYDQSEIDEWRNFMKVYQIPKAIEMINKIQPDIVHNHFAWRFIQFERFIDCPMYTTIHGPITSIHERYTYADHPDHNYISISDNQRKAMPELNWVKTIYNGIDVSKFEVGKKEDRKYFAFLGRISPEKGIKEICETIKKTNHKLVIAAKVDTVDKKYYDEEIAPLIDGKQIKFIGEVDHKGKNKLLKNAKGLLLWLNWEEPFGLAVVEAMACGTPVIVNKRGSMPELVVDGKTGYLVDTLEEMQARMDDVDKIDPEACRSHVEKYFSHTKMTKDYLDLAGKIIGS